MCGLDIGRLAVLDLSSQGHQPMVSSSKQLILTYNGEIYNYLELRAELIRNGLHFRSNSDTEVVLAACEFWGIEKAVSKFEGMFSLALYNVNERVLWLARDPLGIKPLYYTNIGSEFAFASELSALQPLSWLDDKINTDALYAYFRYSCVPRLHLLYVAYINCHQVQYCVGMDVVAKLRRFWNLKKHARNKSITSSNVSLENAADELERQLRLSVKLHMQSDVPYGAFLSGGADSSVVAALMQNVSTIPIKTFTLGFSESTHDETTYARAVAKHLGTEHHELVMNSDDIPALVSGGEIKYDEPFADGSSIPSFLISRFARQHVKVCLSGDGGDELFAGYPRYFWAESIEKLRKWLTPSAAYIASRLLQKLPAYFWDDVINQLTRKRYAGKSGLSTRIKAFY